MILGSIGSDTELRRLGSGGDVVELASRAGRLAGAASPAATAAAVGRLRGALWEALSVGSDATALAPRLAHVCDVVLQAALAAPSRSTGPLADVPHREEQPAAVTNGARALRSVEPEPGAKPEREPSPDLAALDGVVELRAARQPARPWIEAVEHRIESQEPDSLPFTVLVLEADDAERLLAIDHDGDAARALARAEAGVRAAVRGKDVVVREHPGRLWVIADAVGVADARLVGERMADAVTGAGLLHGAPLTVSIGFAGFPDDGADAETLAAHADEGVFAARAAGVRLA